MDPPVVDHYRSFARRYDLASALLLLVGFSDRGWRRRAIDALDLRAGDTVVEIGVGTGQNLAWLVEAVGPGGRVVGVDVTDAMLALARARVEEGGWSNVDLVLADAADFDFPSSIQGVVATFALAFSPRCATIVTHASEALAPGCRLVVLGQKLPPTPIGWLRPLLMLLFNRFGVTDEILDRRPWDRIQAAMGRHLDDLRVDQGYFGLVYLATASRAGSRVDR